MKIYHRAPFMVPAYVSCDDRSRLIATKPAGSINNIRDNTQNPSAMQQDTPIRNNRLGTERSSADFLVNCFSIRLPSSPLFPAGFSFSSFTILPRRAPASSTASSRPNRQESSASLPLSRSLQQRDNNKISQSSRPTTVSLND